MYHSCLPLSTRKNKKKQQKRKKGLTQAHYVGITTLLYIKEAEHYPINKEQNPEYEYPLFYRSNRRCSTNYGQRPREKPEVQNK